MSKLRRPRPRSPPSTASAPGPRQRPVTWPSHTMMVAETSQPPISCWTLRRGLVQEKLKRHLRMRSVINVRQGNRFRTLVVTICYIRLSWSYCLQSTFLHCTWSLPLLRQARTLHWTQFSLELHEKLRLLTE